MGGIVINNQRNSLNQLKSIESDPTDGFQSGCCYDEHSCEEAGEEVAKG